MRAETAATPEVVNFVPAPARERREARGEVEPALIGRVLWRRRKPIVLAAALAGLAALAYSLTATPQFTAVTEILVDPRDKQVVSNDVNPSSISADGGVTQVESQGSVLQSSGVLLRAIAATHLESDPEFNGGGGGLLGLIKLLWKAPDTDAMAERRKTQTLLSLQRHINVKRADKVLVLDLSVRARTADRAAQLANAISDAYLADQADARAASSREASQDLTNRLGQLQADVRKADTAVAEYRATHNFVVSTGQLVSDQELNQTTAQLSNAENRAASLRAQLDQLRRDGATEGTPESMASAVMVRLRDRESAIVERLASASRQLGPLHPEIASIKQSLADVRGLIAKERVRLRQAVEVDYARALDDQKTLRAKLDGMKTKSLDDDKADVHLRELQRQSEAARSIYQAFLLRAHETMEAANVDTTNARVITRALPPLQKSWPPTLLLLLGASFVGFSLAASAALGHEYLHPSLFTPDQARGLVEAPTLGVVPLGELQSGGRALDAVARRLLRGLGDGEAFLGGAIGHSLYVASPPGAAAVRRRLAERVAALAAGDGRQVLLIEGDLDAPASARPGLLDLLRGDAAIADLAYRNEGEGFARLARGGGAAFAVSARAGGDSFRLRRVRRCYDLVVLDGGAMADNLRLAPLAGEADRVLLVALVGAAQSDVAHEVEAALAAGARFDAVALVEPGDV